MLFRGTTSRRYNSASWSAFATICSNKSRRTLRSRTNSTFAEFTCVMVPSGVIKDFICDSSSSGTAWWTGIMTETSSNCPRDCKFSGDTMSIRWVGISSAVDSRSRSCLWRTRMNPSWIRNPLTMSMDFSSVWRRESEYVNFVCGYACNSSARPASSASVFSTTGHGASWNAKLMVSMPEPSYFSAVSDGSAVGKSSRSSSVSGKSSRITPMSWIGGVSDLVRLAAV